MFCFILLICTIFLRLWKQNLPLKWVRLFNPMFAYWARANEPTSVVHVFECCRTISAKPTGIKKRTSPDCLKIRRNCIKTLDFSISIYIIKLQSYINSFLCGWYVSNTYYSPVNVHVNSTYFTRSTPVYWTRLGGNFNVTNTYLPSSYSELGMNILLRTRSAATDLLTSQNLQPIRCAFMLCQFARTRNVYVAT